MAVATIHYAAVNLVWSGFTGPILPEEEVLQHGSPSEATDQRRRIAGPWEL